MLKLKDLFSRGKQSAETKEGPGGTRSSAEKPSGVKAPTKIGTFLNFLPSVTGVFKAKKQLVGLDIGSSSLKLADILETKTGYILNHFSRIALDKGVIEDGVLIDPDALTEKVKALFRGTGLQRKAVVTSLSGHATIVKKVTLPTMEESELREVIHDEAIKYLPFDNMDNVNYDFDILGQNEYNPNQMEVVLVAAKKDIIESFTEAIERAGITVMIMDVDTFSMETAYEANYDFDPADIVVMVNIGASITNINVVKGSMSIFTRDFTLAGNSITEAIQSSQNLTFDAAESLKINGPETDKMSQEAFRESLLNYADPILTEIERSIDYFRSTSGGDNVKKILLSGGVAALPGITAELEQRLGIETEIMNPFRSIEYNKKVLSAERIDEIRPIATVAMGLAMRRVGDK